MAHAGGCYQPQYMLAVIILSCREINGAYVLNKKDPSHGGHKSEFISDKEKTTSVVATPRPESIEDTMATREN